MPRVSSVTARASKKDRRCAKCGEPIEVGQSVYNWTRRNWPTAYQHQACGYPRPSQLSSRKTAQIEDMIQDADWSFDAELGDALPGESFDLDTGHVEEVLGNIADVAESIGAEYAESAEAMPESLQYGSQAEALRDVAERLEEWANDLRAASFDNTRVELREIDDDESLIDWREAMQSEIDETIDALIDEARDMANEMPEYEG